MSQKPTLLLCRPGFEHALAEEVAPVLDPVDSSGFVAAESVPGAPCVFERQRIPDAGFLPRQQLKPVTNRVFDQMAGDLAERDRIWTTHAYSPDGSLDRQAAGLGRAFLRLCRDRLPEARERHRDFIKLRQARTVDVLQMCLVPEGVWYGLTPVDALSDPCPGGIHRMRMDDSAPSRSFLKLEEALDRMDIEPAPGESVVDLGAAPGGWSHSFLKRGCRVTAVDNGPMHMQHPQLEHLLADGISFEPRPVDWLAADMLVPPGTCLGMLRRWLRGKHCRRFVVNAKIPQQHPVPTLAPLLAFLREQKHYQWTCRQLYHDRREVTLWGHREP